MAPYTYSNNNNNYYDPVGSQSSQPQGYTYANTQQQQSSSSSQYPSQSNSTYQANYNQSYNNNAYANQQYASTGQQSSAGSSRINTLSNQNYSQPTSDNRSSNVATQYDNAYYGSAGFSPMNDRGQSNNSPLYASNSATSTFGRLNLPDQSQPSSNTFATTQTYPQSSASNASTSRGYHNAPSSASRGLGSYQNAYTAPQSQQQQPQRYASPLHAVQAQQGHSKQTSRSSNHAPSPRMKQPQQQRQPSASVEPTQTTVDPSQVYDMRAEAQRKAQIEAERRRKAEATRKLEEEARAAEAARKKAEEDQKAEEERQKREAEEAAKKAEEDTKKKAAQERKNEQRRKAREEKRQSKTAATALTQMALSSGMDAMAVTMGDTSNPPANDEEAEMRAMFKKMREFNAKNPAMLAKLWEEERTQHAAQTASPSQPAQPTPLAPALTKQQHKQPQKPAPKPSAPAPSPVVAIPQGLPTAQQQYKPKPTPATQAPPQPVAQQASTALWPPHKKGSLAEAAANWLNNLPENAGFGRTIGKEEVLKILDTNPSYVQLCESIEKTHIRFERSALAKELLKAVPDGLRSGQNGAKPPTSVTPVTGPAAPTTGTFSSVDASSGKKKPGRPEKDGPLSYGLPTQHRDYGPVSYQAPTFTSLSDAAREVNSMSTMPHFAQGMGTVASAITASTPVPPSVQSPFFASGTMPINDSRPVSQQEEVKAEPTAQPEEPPRPPANKEEAARKRTFGDLVDLTTNDDSDDDGPPRKIQQPLSGPMNGAVKHPPPLSEQFRHPPSHGEFWRQNPMPGGPTGPGQILPPGPPRPIWTFNANQKQPTPILPTQRQPPTKTKGPTEEQKQHERMRGKMLVEPIMRDRVARKSKYDSRTIARDVLLATGRHPDMRSLNSHLNPMQKLLGDHGGVIDGAGNKSDLATIRWDIIDPGEARQEAKDRAKFGDIVHGDDTADADTMDVELALATHRDAQKPRGDHQEISEEKMEKFKEIATAEELGRIDEHKMRRKLLNRLNKRILKQRHDEKRKAMMGLIPRGPGVEGNRITNLEHLAQESEDDVTTRGTDAGSSAVKRKRGRPPKTPGNVASPSNNNKIAQSTPGGSPAPRTTPNMSGAVGYSAFRHFDENGNIVKKKGRPVGWRKNLHSREAAGLTPIKTGSSSAKPTPSRLRPSEDFVTPSYPVFACKWRNCTAELDSLARLKKHVLKLHGTASHDGLFECQWKSCKSAGTYVDADGHATSGDEGVTSFATLDHWMQHVNKEHIEEVAWKLGDGPKGGTVSEIQNDSDVYLSDAYGRSITPVIFPPPELQESKDDGSGERVVKSDLPQPKKIGRPPKQPMYRPDGTAITKEERDAMEELQKLKTQKFHEGISMGREGSRLAIEKRRLGFLDDEDFEDLVSDSD